MLTNVGKLRIIYSCVAFVALAFIGRVFVGRPVRFSYLVFEALVLG
jgi:hypothetical protein